MTTPAHLYACVYAREFPIQAMLRLRPDLREKPCVVMEGEPPFEFVCSHNTKAHTLGVARGMTKVEIDTFPTVTVLSRSTKEEESAKVALLACAGSFSPRIEDASNDHSFVCVVDIAGTETLFGPSATLAENLCTEMKALGIAASIAVSRNFYAAMCLARGRGSRTGFNVIEPGSEQIALADLPLAVLDLSEEHTQTFSIWGIRSLGMLAELPEKALIARMGQEGKRLRQLARGEKDHLFLPVEPAFTLEERMELDNQVELLDSLLFIVGVMLEQLILRAKTRIVALASVTVTLLLKRGACHTRTVRPALATNDRQLWIKLIHLDLEAHPPQAAILALTLEAEAGTTSKVQLGLFSPQLPEPARLDVMLARIRAIVGEDNVGRAVLKDTHQPDGFRMEPFTVAAGPPLEAAQRQHRIALRRVRPVVPIAVTLSGKRPASFFFREKRYVVEEAYGPWLRSGEWWSPTVWSLHEWHLVARSQDGNLLSCSLAHDVIQSDWQMVGLYD